MNQTTASVRATHTARGMSMPWHFNDGGRKAAGYKGFAGDCVVRAICIVGALEYPRVYDELFERARAHNARRPAKNQKTTVSPRDGVRRAVYHPYLIESGWQWAPLLGIGTGCQTHLAADELPSTGRLLIRLSKHLTALIDGTLHDIYDPQRFTEKYLESQVTILVPTRCVYGYYLPPTPSYKKAHDGEG